jgi:hypothetical protein
MYSFAGNLIDFGFTFYKLNRKMDKKSMAKYKKQRGIK